MNNDLELNSKKKDNIEDNIKTIFLNIVVNEIPTNKRNAIKYLNNLSIDMENEVDDVYGYVSNSICKDIIKELINDITSLKFNSRFGIKELIKDKIKLYQKNDINFIIDENENENDDDDEYIDEEIERLQQKKKQKLDKDYSSLVSINNSNSNNNDLKYFKSLKDNDKKQYIQTLNLLNNDDNNKPLLLQLADLKTTDHNKKIILEKINTFNSLENNTGEYCKLNNWINDIMKIPFGNYIDITDNLNSKPKINKKLNNINKKLNDTIYGHEQAKNKILQYVAELITNKEEISNIITLQGPPGIGKTAVIQNGVSEAFELPFNFVSLGGATDASYIEGFDYTYEGSTYGKIVDILIRSKCMNPIIYFDELDKISETPKGEEIINILTHITDNIQNNHFNDKYFSGINFDISKVIFIFSCNDLSKINKVLQDRMHIINLESFTNKDKIQISQKYILPKLYKNFNFNINISDNVIEYIINTFTYEGGVRKLKENLYEILREVNLRFITNKKILNKKIKYPLNLTEDMIKKDILLYKPKINFQLIHNKPKVGVINGLWACDYGIGGIAPIEVVHSYSDNNLELELTGSQGNVMQESMKVAKSVALSLLTTQKINNLFKKLKTTKLSGIHIHCPDGSTPIDGPSAGCAISIAIYSLLINKPINNTIAITGELTLQGSITEIGGLKEKIYGAINAGIETILYPEENNLDIKLLLEKDSTIKDKIKFISIKNIKDAIKYIF